MIQPENIYQDVRYLTEEIGIRIAGSEKEKLASEYLKQRFLQYIPDCRLEEFQTKCRKVSKEELRAQIEGVWVEIPVRLRNVSPTTNGRTVEAQPVFFDGHTDYQRSDISYVNGKAVIHYGGFPTEDDYRRMMEAEPAFLIVADTRYTGNSIVANSLLPANVEKFGAVPSVDVSFPDVWRICTQKVTMLSLCIEGSMEIGCSQNIIATIPGTDPEAGCIYLGSHVDSVAGSPGADDNAVGCAMLLEIARVLSRKRYRNTIRFIAFGSEEQLSVGSAAYVRKHCKELETKGLFICNFDSCASAVGWNKFVINANELLRTKMKEIYNRQDIFYNEILEPDPYNDVFPFTAAGVPGITLMRNNCEAGKFYHHTPDNTLQAISPGIAAKLAEASAKLVLKLADMSYNRDKYTIAAGTEKKVSELWEENYGGWQNV